MIRCPSRVLSVLSRASVTDVERDRSHWCGQECQGAAVRELIHAMIMTVTENYVTVRRYTL
jgi:hypothetical protein